MQGGNHELITDWCALVDRADEWSALLARSGADEPMQSPLWLDAWWSEFGALGDRGLRCAVVWDDRRAIGIAPLVRRWQWYRSRIPFRRLELVGSGEDERDEICSEYIGIVAERGAEARVAGVVVAALAAGELGSWDELVLAAMDGTAPMVAALEQALGRAGYRVTREISSTAPHIPLPGRWDDYLASLPRASRYLVRRSERDLLAWAKDSLRIERATDAASLERGAQILRSLHRQRWGGGGAFASPRFRGFHDRVMPALLARGELDLSWLLARGEPIAALYNIAANGKVYYYQSGRRRDLPRDIRPGIALHAAAIRRAIAAGLREYDFLAGAQRFKRQLALAERPIVALRVARGPAELARRAASRLARAPVSAWLLGRGGS